MLVLTACPECAHNRLLPHCTVMMAGSCMVALLIWSALSLRRPVYRCHASTRLDRALSLTVTGLLFLGLLKVLRGVLWGFVEGCVIALHGIVHRTCEKVTNFGTVS